MKITLPEQIKSVQREIAMRKSAYPKWVAKNLMTQAKADHELAAMEAVLRSLQILQTYADPNNWRFDHDEKQSLFWICKQGPEPAQEASNGNSSD